jgi:hypothetical protein
MGPCVDTAGKVVADAGAEGADSLPAPSYAVTV